MSDYVLEPKGVLTEIANAIRDKTGSTDAMTVAQMAALISGIETNSAPSVGGHNVVIGQVTPNENGEINAELGSNMNSALFIAIWLDDVSLAANYTNTSIVISYTTNRYDNATIIDAIKAGTAVVYRKTANAIQLSNLLTGKLYAKSQPNSAFAEYYVLVPEVYNYMIVY